MDNGGSGSNGVPRSDVELGKNIGSNANEGAFANGDITADVNAGGDVDVVSNLVVMVNSTGGVEDGVMANSSVGIDDDSGADHGAGVNRDGRGDDGVGMNGSGKLGALGLELVVDFLAGRVVTDSDDDLVVVDFWELLEITKDGDTEKFFAEELGVVIEIADRLKIFAHFATEQQDFGNDLGVTSSGKNNYFFHGSCKIR
jgi:hypothetical protein